MSAADRSARRAAARATHPDLGGSAEAFRAAMAGFEAPPSVTRPEPPFVVRSRRPLVRAGRRAADRPRGLRRHLPRRLPGVHRYASL